MLRLPRGGGPARRMGKRSHPRQQGSEGGNVLWFDVWGPIGLLDPKGPEGGSAKRLFPFIYSYLFTKDDPDFLKKIWSLEILPQSDVNYVDSANHPIGSVPFRFSHRKREEEVGLVVNENYYRGRPFLDGVTICFQPD